MSGDRRRLVAGFGYGLQQCGWAATADLLQYELRRRVGEWESRYVGAAGRLHQVIVMDSEQEAVALRDRLNNASVEELKRLVGRQGSPRPTVEALALVLEAGWRSFEATGEARSDLRRMVWQVLDTDPADLEGILRPLRVQTQPPPQSWPPFDQFPFRAVVFDLDQTLVDSSQLGTPAARRSWAENGGSDDRISTFEVAGSVQPHALPALLAERNVPVGLVTRSPARYAERVLRRFDIHADNVQAGSGDKVASLEACAKRLGVAPEEMVVVGDDLSDFRAADELGAWTIGALWTTDSWAERQQPDIACRKPELLLRVVDWTRLGLLAEQEAGSKPLLHAGSWIAHASAPGTYSLGRYFASRDPRHEEPLSQAIIAGKETSNPDPDVAQALRLFAERVRERAAIDIVASVPNEAGRCDRFARYREIAAETLGAQSARLLTSNKTVTGYKRRNRADRAAANEGRFSADRDADGLRVLLLDDVRTSGATLAACASALRGVGAAEVSCLAFATTQD
jgi:HAD superfamily hydrolase (TIGR01549 family)